MANKTSKPSAAKGNIPSVDVKAPAKPKQELIIPVLKKSALSKDLGPQLVKSAFQSYDDEAKIEALRMGAEKTKHLVMASLTAAILKAAKADDSIDLTATTKTGPDGQKAMGLLNDQVCIALGIREVVSVGNGEKAKEKIIWAKSVAQYFPQTGEDKETEEYKRKNTFRGNFMNQVKKAEMTALGIMDNDITAVMDKKAGTLQLTGPAVKKQFGAPSVLLNEKQTVTDAKGKETKLSEKPSFTAIASKAKEDHGGAPLNRTSGTRGAAAQSLSNPGLALAGICKAMVEALDRLKKPTATMIVSVKKVESAVDTWLNNFDTESRGEGVAETATA